MYCDNCGFALEESDKFCKNCGKELSPPAKGSALEAASGVQEKNILLIKSNDQTTEVDDIPIEQDGNDNNLLRLFVGEKKANYYLSKWSKGNRSWNWAAFFLGIFWLGYRKMFKLILVILGLYLVSDLVMALLGIEDNYVSSSIGIGLGVTLGMYGNYIYRKHTVDTIENMKQSYADFGMLEIQIKQKGGGSWRGVFGAFGLLVGYLILATLIVFFVPPIKQSAVTDQVKAIETIDSSPEVETDNAVKLESDIESEVLETLERNLTTLESENVTEYMSMIDETNEEEYAGTYETLEEMFLYYDMTYELKDVEFLSISDQEVKVRVTQVSKVIDGRIGWRDNESVIVHTLKHQPAGEWLFASSFAESVIYLDEGKTVYTAEQSPANAYTIMAPGMFDFEIFEEFDVNNDGIPEKITFEGGPITEGISLNKNIEVIITFESGEEITVPYPLEAGGQPVLYFYDMNQDGWMEIFYESGDIPPAPPIFEFTPDGLEYMLSLGGRIEAFDEEEVHTTEEVFTYDWIYEYTHSLNMEQDIDSEGYTSETGEMEQDKETEEMESEEIVEKEATVEETIVEDESLLLGIHLDDFMSQFIEGYNKNLETVESVADSNDYEYEEGEEMFSWQLAENITFYGLFNAEKQLNRVGITHDLSNPTEIEEAGEAAKIYLSATSAIISSLGDGEQSETIYQNLIDQQYKEFKDHGEYILGDSKYVDYKTEEVSVFMAMNKEDSFE